MTLSQAREIYRKALRAVDPSETGVTLSSAKNLKDLARYIAKVGGFQVWEIEE